MSLKIICHMVSSIDGRLLPERWTSPASGSKSALLEQYEDIATALNADGWMIGRKTMAYYAQEQARQPVTAKDNLHQTREPYAAPGRQGQRLAIALDPHGKLHYRESTVNGNHLVTILSEQVDDTYLAQLRAQGISYLFAGPHGDNLQHAMQTLDDTFGVKTILLEGGGIINGAFLKAGLIDEISLLIYPGIDGLAGIPSIFEYIGHGSEQPAAGQTLEHFHTQTREGGMIWLRYHVHQNTPAV